jgi:hypothetical protein
MKLTAVCEGGQTQLIDDLQRQLSNVNVEVYKKDQEIKQLSDKIVEERKLQQIYLNEVRRRCTLVASFCFRGCGV